VSSIVLDYVPTKYTGAVAFVMEL